MPDSRHLLALYYKQHTDHAQIGVVTIPSGEFHSVTNDVNSYSQLALSGNGRTLATVLTNVDRASLCMNLMAVNRSRRCRCGLSQTPSPGPRRTVYYMSLEV
jgi:hypothetical protein